MSNKSKTPKQLKIAVNQYIKGVQETFKQERKASDIRILNYDTIAIRIVEPEDLLFAYKKQSELTEFNCKLTEKQVTVFDDKEYYFIFALSKKKKNVLSRSVFLKELCSSLK